MVSLISQGITHAAQATMSLASKIKRHPFLASAAVVSVVAAYYFTSSSSPLSSPLSSEEWVYDDSRRMLGEEISSSIKLARDTLRDLEIKFAHFARDALNGSTAPNKVLHYKDVGCDTSTGKCGIIPMISESKVYLSSLSTCWEILTERLQHNFTTIRDLKMCEAVLDWPFPR